MPADRCEGPRSFRKQAAQKCDPHADSKPRVTKPEVMYPLLTRWLTRRLLCPDVGCVEVGKMTADCVLASVPPRAVVTRGDMAVRVPGQILLNATRDKAFQALFFAGTNTGNAVFR